jgi:hypothetical protein
MRFSNSVPPSTGRTRVSSVASLTHPPNPTGGLGNVRQARILGYVNRSAASPKAPVADIMT